MNPSANRHMSHDEAVAGLEAVAFNLLDRPERDAVMAHVDQCPKCRAERRTSSAGSADRAGAEQQARHLKSTPLVFPTVPDQARAVASPGIAVRRGAQWMAVAAGVLLAASIGLFWLAARDRNELRATLKNEGTQAMQSRLTTDSLSRQLALRDSLIAGVSGRAVLVLTLTSRAAGGPYARMFWDIERDSWTFLAHDMPALKPGRTYQLWLITSKTKVSAGTFGVENGGAVVLAKQELAEPLNAVAVTEEPAGGVPQPTGPVVIAASAATK